MITSILHPSKDFTVLKKSAVNQLNKKATCPTCNGKGILEPGLICKRCNGTGQIQVL